MKINDFTGLYHMHEEINPEVFAAQRLQELKDLAEWRSRHLQQIKDWSDVDKRNAKLIEHELNDLVARGIANERAKNDPEYIRSLMSAKHWKWFGSPVFGKIEDRLKITPTEPNPGGLAAWMPDPNTEAMFGMNREAVVKRFNQEIKVRRWWQFWK